MRIFFNLQVESVDIEKRFDAITTNLHQSVFFVKTRFEKKNYISSIFSCNQTNKKRWLWFKHFFVGVMCVKSVIFSLQLLTKIFTSRMVCSIVLICEKINIYETSVDIRTLRVLSTFSWCKLWIIFTMKKKITKKLSFPL